MTDNEIIKALECCTGYDCENCKALKYCDYMHPGALARASLDLINRQKEEIERLNEKITAKDESNYYLMGQLRLEKEKRLTAKSEAIKEFANRLKNKIKTECNPYGKPTFDYDTSLAIMCYIDNLVKEMTEVEINQRKEDEGK